MAIEGIATLIVCSFMYRLNQNLWRPLVNVYFESIGITIVTIGLLNSIRDLISSLTMMPAGSISDKVGRKKPILASILLHLTFVCLMILTKNIWILFFAISLEGIALGMQEPSIAAYVADMVRGARSGMAYSSLNFFTLCGGIISTMIGAFLAEQYGYSSNFVITAFMLIFTFVIAFFFLKESLAGKLEGFRRSVKTSLPELLPNFQKAMTNDKMGLLIAGCVFHHIGAVLVNTYLSLYATLILKYDLVTVGLLLSLRQLGDVLGTLPSGKIIERFGGEITLFMHVLSSAPMAYLFATSNNFAITAIIMLIWGTETGWDNPSRRLLSVKYGEFLGRATAMGVVQSLISLSGILSPIIGGLMWSAYGPVFVFYASFTVNIFASFPLVILVYKAHTNPTK